MGWESGVSLGASAYSGYNTINNALAQSSAIAQSADNTAANLANKTSRTEGTLETSFIKGGIALDNLGGTKAVFAQAAAQGQTDIQRTIDNANSSISNTMNAARTNALNTIASSIGKLGAGTISNSLGAAWNGLTGNTDPTPLTGTMADYGSGTGALY